MFLISFHIELARSVPLLTSYTFLWGIVLSCIQMWNSSLTSNRLSTPKGLQCSLNYRDASQTMVGYKHRFFPLLFSYISSHSKQSFTLSFRFALTSATQSITKWKPLSFFSTVTQLCYQSQVRSVCEFVWDVLWIKAWCGSSLKREYAKDGGGKQGSWGLICGDGEGKIFFWVVKEQQ